MPANLLLELPDVDIDTVARTSTGIEIVAHSRTQTGVCPDCQHPSHSLHSRYRREPQDLPCFGEPVRLKLTVSRFRCRNPECRRQTFVERLPNLVAFYARCTRRLAAVLQLTTIESGAETGVRITTAATHRTSGALCAGSSPSSLGLAAAADCATSRTVYQNRETLFGSGHAVTYAPLPYVQTGSPQGLSTAAMERRLPQCPQAAR